MNLVHIYKCYKKSNGVSIDSRSIKEGEMFFALKGPNFDGHKYLDAAFENGASYAVIDDSAYRDVENVLLVSDSEVALQNLAKYHRCMLSIPVIGITGSNGKTTTKELLAAVLSTQYSVFATKGNYNNHLGVPLSVLSIQDYHEMAIIEMGANHLGEIKFLSEIAMPDYGLITNIGKAHLEGFGSIEGVRKGKTELYRYLASTKGTIFFNTEDGRLRKSITEETKNIAYKLSDGALVKAFPFVGFQFEDVYIQSNLSGTYNLLNMLAALTVGKYFNVPNSEMKKGIESYIPTNNRSQVKKTKNNVLILDAYNANPSSMVESIKNFNLFPTESKILILGHMLELGDSSREEHLKLISFISSFEWDSVFLVGQHFCDLEVSTPFEICSNTTELMAKLRTLNLRGYTILLKGSRGVALEKCVEYL